MLGLISGSKAKSFSLLILRALKVCAIFCCFVFFKDLSYFVLNRVDKYDAGGKYCSDVGLFLRSDKRCWLCVIPSV